jgi:hypothetical protein
VAFGSKRHLVNFDFDIVDLVQSGTGEILVLRPRVYRASGQTAAVIRPAAALLGSRRRCLPRLVVAASLPRVKGHRADAEATAELGDRKVGVDLAQNVAAPPFAPSLPIGSQSKPELVCSPGTVD